MDDSPQKRVLTESLYEGTRPAPSKHHELLSADLIARLQNVGRRVRYNVSQGYASNRTTPFTTPNTSPVKTQLTNPYNTPQTSPVRRNIFKTETEVVQEAVGELDLNEKVDKVTRKRGREVLEESDEDEEGEERVGKGLDGRRVIKALKKLERVEETPFTEGEENEVNPFLVSGSQNP